MSRRSRVRSLRQAAPELNITAFLNLMVILVPFLLITAVFSHMTILELNLPPQSKSKPKPNDAKKVLNFELIIRKDVMILADTIGGPIKEFSKKDGQYDMNALSDILVKLKTKFPTKQNITLLLEPNVPYDALVQAMDTVRLVKITEDGETVNRELFPQIAIGDAPRSDGASRNSGK